MAKDSYRRYSQLPTPLHKAVEQATKPAFRKHGIAESRLITEWGHIAGEVLANKTLPKRLVFAKNKRDNGTLHLTVAPGWALEVQHLEPIILEKIATFFGYRAVAALHITQAPLPIKPIRSKKTYAPLSQKASETLQDLTNTVEDDALRNALRSLGAAIMRDKED
ncbi:MAG: DciA family protein [Alphaproteobacteria bacterium]|nr:DciA family protein [Alphaproteobacteria bacterium]